jgi:methylated-DNA-[protein]-cysteine S-methyltransferase
VPEHHLSIASATIARLGRVEVAATDQGVCALALPQWNDHDLRLGPWERAGWRARRGPHPILSQAFEQLRRHAKDGRAGFDVPLDLSLLTEFTRRVLTALCQVGAGSLLTYAQLAVRAGSPGAARAVGGAVGRNPIPLIIPCHRVVASGGIGGFGLGLECKRALLEMEGMTGL